MNRFLMGAALLALMTTVAAADQRLSARPNGTVRITGSATDVTRITIAGDRIRRIIKDQSAFQEMNDEATGDVFLRYGGPQDKLTPETGYIITEKGATISYELTPKLGLGAETVQISIAGSPAAATAGATGAARASGRRAEPAFELAAGEGGGGYSGSLVAFARSVINKHVGFKAPPSRAHGAVVASERGSGMRARVVVAAAGASTRYVRPQEFFRSGVLAVWVERHALNPRERAWVVIVEKG